MAGLTVAVDKALAISEVALLSRMRTRFIAALASTPTAPLAFHERNGRKLDVEAEVLGILEMLASRTAGSTPRPMAERAAALKVLKSYARSENYKPIAERLVARLELEIHDSTDAMAKEAARKLRADFLKQEIPAKEEE